MVPACTGPAPREAGGDAYCEFNDIGDDLVLALRWCLQKHYGEGDCRCGGDGGDDAFEGADSPEALQ